MIAAFLSFFINVVLALNPTTTADVPTQDQPASQTQTMGTADGGTSTWSEATK